MKLFLKQCSSDRGVVRRRKGGGQKKKTKQNKQTTIKKVAATKVRMIRYYSYYGQGPQGRMHYFEMLSNC